MIINPKKIKKLINNLFDHFIILDWKIFKRIAKINGIRIFIQNLKIGSGIGKSSHHK